MNVCMCQELGICTYSATVFRVYESVHERLPTISVNCNVLSQQVSLDCLVLQ